MEMPPRYWNSNAMIRDTIIPTMQWYVSIVVLKWCGFRWTTTHWISYARIGIVGCDMAKKFQQLAIAPDGEIVFRSTGKIVTKNVTLKGNRAYVDGRLYGYIGKPTKSQKEKIEKVASGATRKRRAKIKDKAEEIRRQGLVIAKPPTVKTAKSIRSYINAVALQAEAVRYIHKKYGDKGIIEISKIEQSELNYAMVLKKAMRAGKISPYQADILMRQMQSALDNDAKRKIWQATAKYFDKVAYKYTIHSRVKDSEDSDS